MSFRDRTRHIIIFDTNILFEDVENRCDFTQFRFNKLFRNIIDAIEERDLIENIEIMIPSVVWNEMLYQRVEGYKKKKKEIERLLERFKLPDLEYEFREIDYISHIENSIYIYKEKLKRYSVRVSELELPNNSRFESIIGRAFCKKPPFEGKDKKSDKGFKDALIWESILEFRTNNSDNQIYLYSRDGLFNQILKEEYEDMFGEEIILLDEEKSVLEQLEKLSQKYKKDGVENYEEMELYGIIKDKVSEEFVAKLLYEIGVNIVVGSKIYDLSHINNLKIKNIANVTEDTDIDMLEYSLEAIISCTVSNVDENSDIEYKNEKLNIFINYNTSSKNLSIDKISIFGDEFNCINCSIGGSQYV